MDAVAEIDIGQYSRQFIRACGDSTSPSVCYKKRPVTGFKGGEIGANRNLSCHQDPACPGGFHRATFQVTGLFRQQTQQHPCA